MGCDAVGSCGVFPVGKKENDDEEGENSIKKSKIFLIISLSFILVLIICFILAIVLLPKNPKQIIYKRTGIAFQESAEIIEFDCEKNGTFEATVRIKNEDRNALENQLIDNSFTKQKRLLWPLKEYLEDDKEDYSYFAAVGVQK